MESATPPIANAKLLIVDDEKEVAGLLTEFFQDHDCLTECAYDGEEALIKLDDFQPHCILLDVRMPYLNGIEALKMIKHRAAEVEVIMVTAVGNVKIAEECIRSGAFGYVTKPVDLDHLLKEVQGALTHRKTNLKDRKKTRAEAKEKSELALMVRLLNTELFHALQFSVELAGYLDPEFACHSQNVAWLSQKIAEKMDLPHSRLCYLAGLYHDIGKLSFPRLFRTRPPEDWTQGEDRLFKKFPAYSQELLQSHFHLTGLKTVIGHQCEHVDGSGFPDALEGDEIPMESKILAVANRFDEEMRAFNFRRIETEIGKGGEALRSIQKDAGKKYAPPVVEALARLVAESRNKVPREKLVYLKDLEEGMRPSRDTFTRSGKFLLARGQPFTKFRIQKLRDIHSIDPIEDPVHIRQENS